MKIFVSANFHIAKLSGTSVPGLGIFRSWERGTKVAPRHVSHTSTRKLTNLILLPLIVTLLLAFVFTPSISWAEDVNSSDSTESSEINPFDYLPLDVTTSTDDLPSNQIRVTVVGTNELGLDLSDHSVSFDVPDGWSLVDGSATSDAKTTKDGETVSTTGVIAKNYGSKTDQTGNDSDSGAASNSSIAKGGKGLPSTGSTLTIVAIIATLAIITAAGIHITKRKGVRTALGVVLAILLVWNLTPSGAVQAYADEQAADGSNTGSDTSLDDSFMAGLDAPFALTKTVDVDDNGETLSIKATVSCNLAGNNAGIVNLELSRPIGVGAQTTTVVVNSETAYAGSSETEGEMRTFDTSKITLSGSLSDAAVRPGAYTVKVGGTDENSNSLEDRTHYELRLTIDNIAEGVASEDSDYGYIELTDQPFADESQSYGIACVSYADSAGSIAQITSELPIGDDAIAHTFDNGLYWDGDNKFRVPVDLDGVEVGLPIRSDSEFAQYATGYTFTIDGVEYHTFTNDDILANIQLPYDYGISIVECTNDLGYTWLTFQVNGDTGAAAYKRLTTALSQGLLFGGQITATFKNTIVYPDGMDGAASEENGDPFAYAESNPIAFAWAVQLERGERNTTITYLAAAHSSEETDGSDTAGSINLVDGTTFSAYKTSTGDDGKSEQSPASDIKASTYDAENNIFKIDVAVPNDQFDSDAELLGLSESDKDGLFNSLYTYVNGIELRMNDGSTNAFGVPEQDKSVALFDGESVKSATSDTDEDEDDGNSSGNENEISLTSTDDGETATSDTLTMLDVSDVICRYQSLTIASANIQENTGKNIEALGVVYKRTSNESKTDSQIKKVLNSAVSVGFGINHAVNLVKVLGGGFFNYATAIFTVTGLIGAFVFDLLPEETETYSIDDVMNKLDEMNKKIDSIETTVNTINVKMDEQTDKILWKGDDATYTNLKSFLCSQTTTNIFSGMDSVLGNYYELDKDGKKTTTPCSRTTSLSRMPEDAIDALEKYLNRIDKNAENKGFNGIGGAYTALRNVLVPGAAGSENILDNYFNYVDSKYNWNVETLSAKRAFLASFMVMHNNAYTLYSAKLGVELYKARNDAATTAAIKVDVDELQQYSDDMSAVLYGAVNWDQLRKDYPGESKDYPEGDSGAVSDIDREALLKDNPGKTFDEVVQEKYHTESAYIQATKDTESTELTFIATDSARQRTYSTSSYALTAAYDESCFALVYLSGKQEDSPDNSWKPENENSFAFDELQTMVKRLNNLPASMRLTIADSDGTRRPVENIIEEMEALGFKSVNPNAQYNKQLLQIDTATMKEREKQITGSVNEDSWVQNGSTTKVWATVNANEENPTDEVDRYSDKAHNWNYFFTEYGYRLTTLKDEKDTLYLRTQYVSELSSSSTNRPISSVKVGNQITDPESYAVITADDAKIVSKTTWGGNVDGFTKDIPTKVVARYGKVYNLAKDQIISNQLLYMYEVPDVPIFIWLMLGDTPYAKVEYYAFGTINLNVTSPKDLMSSYKTWYQQNWYSEAGGSQNAILDKKRNGGYTSI